MKQRNNLEKVFDNIKIQLKKYENEEEKPSVYEQFLSSRLNRNDCVIIYIIVIKL